MESVLEIWRCNCPDWTGGQAALLITNQLSLTRDRDWSASNFGPKATGWCKHLYAVRLLRGEKIEAINDPPVEGATIKI